MINETTVEFSREIAMGYAHSKFEDFRGNGGYNEEEESRRPSDGWGSGQRPSSHMYLYQGDSMPAACGHFGDAKRVRREITTGKKKRRLSVRHKTHSLRRLITLKIQFRLPGIKVSWLHLRRIIAFP